MKGPTSGQTEGLPEALNVIGPRAHSTGHSVGNGATAASAAALLSGEDRRISARLARTLLLPLSWLYGAGVVAYRQLYARGLLRTRTLPCRVIAVGNLTVGGTGKSTMTRWLARLLTDHGKRVAVLSYGYRAAGGRGDAVTVVSDGQRLRAPVAVSGDEPRMLAEALPGVPVLVGPRRVLSGAVAAREFGAEVCLLDDGFQYWRLRKDLEIVLLDASCPFGYGYLLPRGLMREPAGSLGRADVVVLMNGHRLPGEERQALKARLGSLAPEALLCEGRHAPRSLQDLFNGTEERLAWLKGRRVAALSSLGNPEGFERSLRDLGVRELEARRFPDHHLYSVAEAEAALRAPACDAVITTAKDAPKLRHVLAQSRRPVERPPVFVLEVDLELTEGAPAFTRRVLEAAGV